MDWTTLAIAIAVIGAWLLLKRTGLADASTARRLHQSGAPLVDVRTAGEFASGGLPGAINIPLNTLQEAFPARFPDRTKPVLLHCASGTRSDMARSRLRALGYREVYNVGSAGRAASVLGLTGSGFRR